MGCVNNAAHFIATERVGGYECGFVLAACKVDEHTDYSNREHQNETSIKNIILVQSHQSFRFNSSHCYSLLLYLISGPVISYPSNAKIGPEMYHRLRTTRIISNFCDKKAEKTGFYHFGVVRNMRISSSMKYGIRTAAPG